MLKNKKLKNTLLILGFSGLMLNNAFAQEENVDFQMSPEQQQQMSQQQQQQQQIQQQQQQMQQQQQQQQMMMQQQQMQQYNNSRMSLEEALQLESQITRSKLQQQLNKELKKEIGEQQKIIPATTAVINKQNDKKPVIATTNSEPILKSIRGVPGNLKAYISINNVTAIGKRGDVIGGWEITKITDSYVILQKNSVKKKLSFYN